MLVVLNSYKSSVSLLFSNRSDATLFGIGVQPNFRLVIFSSVSILYLPSKFEYCEYHCYCIQNLLLINSNKAFLEKEKYKVEQY